MTSEQNLDQSLTRLEIAEQLDRLAKDVQKANARLISYIVQTTGGDDQTVDMTLTAALRFSEKIGEKAHFVRTAAGKLRDADKEEARERNADEFMSRILKARIGGEA